MTRRLPRAGVLVALVLLLAVVVGASRWIVVGDTYRAELPHAGQLRSGDTVRVAGLDVGKVEEVTSEGDRVLVEFSVEDRAAALTDDTVAEVKLLSLLGQRYLDLEPGSGDELGAGETISLAHAADTYTMERFWTDGPRQVERLDQEALEEAIDVLGTDLAGAPDDIRAALDGLTAVSGIVTRREEQIGQLLVSTRSVTDLVVEQKGRLVALMEDADLVMRMVHQRREAIRLLLRDARALVVELTAIARENERPMASALRRMERLLGVLVDHREQLDRVLEMSGPTMRYFNNVVGDGPWMGVNSPWAIVPDDLICVLTPGKCQ